MLIHFAPASGIVLAILVGCFVLVLAFEATNGLHDTSNAVATVIYTNSLKPTYAVVWSGLLNFVGALVGVAAGDALLRARGLSQGVDWHGRAHRAGLGVHPSAIVRTCAGVAPRSRSARRLSAPSRLLSRRPAASVNRAWCA